MKPELQSYRIPKAGFLSPNLNQAKNLVFDVSKLPRILLSEEKDSTSRWQLILP